MQPVGRCAVMHGCIGGGQGLVWVDVCWWAVGRRTEGMICQCRHGSSCGLASCVCLVALVDSLPGAAPLIRPSRAVYVSYGLMRGLDGRGISRSLPLFSSLLSPRTSPPLGYAHLLAATLLCVEGAWLCGAVRWGMWHGPASQGVLLCAFGRLADKDDDSTGCWELNAPDEGGP